MSTEVSSEGREAAYDLALVLADTKFITAHRYSEWGMLGAPDIEEDIALSSVIQDELGHARSAYRAAAKIGADVDGAADDVDELLYERETDEWRSATVLDGELENWADIVGSLAFLDFATVLVFENVRDGTFDALQGMAGKVLQEESQHVQHGQAWLGVFADPDQDEFDAADMQAAIDRFVPGVAAWLGTGGSELVDAGVFTRTNDEMREEFLAEIETLVEANGYEMPDIPEDWDDWDASTRRTAPPDPASFTETVDEATGREHRYLAG
ncbi:1,2-phenylacetyl-CoA epoxidase subunit PaaC [Haloarchaeobius baliensis]|uniref:1,2-phenylacetyl-CoA epoxidase subunit PaaC n=1 Tax=Haloarchaeobius baliensis TaxID=1670458 RepID=UPI003F8836BA